MKTRVSAGAFACSLVLATVASAATTVVRPGLMNGWTAGGSGGAAAAFVAGPDTAPAGSGSAELSVGANGDDAAQLRYGGFAGVELADLTALTYSTYVQQDGSGGQAPYLLLNVDLDGNGTTDDLLFFEPVYQDATFFPSNPQGPLVTSTWQTWDALAGGWWSLGGVAGAGPGVGVKSLAQYLAAQPDARLATTTAGALRVVAGFGAGAWDGFVGNADALTVGVAASSTTFDFEPGETLGACAVTTEPSTQTVRLVADCTTTATILVPDGWTLDGDGHTITAVDPPGDHFRGAVVRNGGAVAHVTDVTVTASGLANVCDGGDDRLRGILLQGAAGSITDTTVTGINQGASGCQEGNGIEARNEPFDTTGTDVAVTISGNTVAGYQKNGITANGSVAASITGNTVTGAGPVDYIAQNGIQVGFGATALVSDNVVGGNDYTPDAWVACGVLYYQADGVSAFRNTYAGNERDVCNFGRGGGRFNSSS